MRYDDVNAYFDKIFYINLPNDTLRNEMMLNQFEKFGIHNYERIEGVIVDTILEENLYRNYNNFDRKYVLGSLGCCMSHLKAVELSKARGYKKVMVLEDDVTFLQDPSKLIASNEGILNDWDVLYFGGLVEPFFRNQIVCLHAYAIRNVVFNDVISMSLASGMEIDNFYAKILQHMSYNKNQSGKYNIRMIQPFNTIVQNKNLQTNIQSVIK